MKIINQKVGVFFWKLIVAIPINSPRHWDSINSFPIATILLEPPSITLTSSLPQDLISTARAVWCFDLII